MDHISGTIVGRPAPSQASECPMGATEEAEALAARDGLQEALQAIVNWAYANASCQMATVSLTRYDDFSGVELLKVELHCGLRGKHAVAKEDELLDDMADTLGMDIVNRFLIIMR